MNEELGRLAPQIGAYYEKRYPGIVFLNNEGVITAEYMGRKATLKYLTSIDSGLVDAFDKIRPATYQKVEWQVTGDTAMDIISGCRAVLETTASLNDKQVIIGALAVLYGRPKE